MTTRIVTPPAGPLNAVVTVPGSKSVANRALVCAMLANGESVISGLPDGDDTAVFVDVLKEMNRSHELRRDAVVVSGDASGALPGIVDGRLAGTSSRFLTAIAALGNSTTVVDGGEPLRLRPMHDLHQALVDLGADVVSLGEHGHLPVSVSRGSLVGGAVQIKGDVSSQFISALMLIGPVLPRGLEISIVGDLVSRSYVEMTAAVMSSFSAEVEVRENTIFISPTGYVACDYRVEPDYSSAAFPIAAVLIRGGEVRLSGLASSRMQGDAAMADIAVAMGAEIVIDGDDVIVRRESTAPLKPLTMNMADCSDLVPAVATACVFADGKSVITGVGFIRNKESDRLGDFAREISKAGATVQVDDDGLNIAGVETVHPAEMGTHHDHRLAMALALVALRSAEVTILDANVVSKSWPLYFSDMQSILG